jgi:hypothetical protein
MSFNNIQKANIQKAINTLIKRAADANKEEAEDKEEQSTNLFAIDIERVSPTVRRKIFGDLSAGLHSALFNDTYTINNYSIQLSNLVSAYRYTGTNIVISDDYLKEFLTSQRYVNLLVALIHSVQIKNSCRIDSIVDSIDSQNLSDEEKREGTKQVKKKVTDNPIYNYVIEQSKNIDEEDIKETGIMNAAFNALTKLEGEVALSLDSDNQAEILKLMDKYSIRLGDGKYFVASDNVKVSFRDPSDKPSWATWFLEAVPLASIPNRAELLFLKPEDRAQHCPPELSDNPIICHASLWKLESDVTGLLFHTSWNHISATYRWKIAKPFEIASILFRAVSHPAHLARNFGYAPQIALPGNDWF